jgi:UDP-glucose 4-epimerase
MTWLVTGGAGYIGAHVVRAFADRGLSAVVLDDLSSGHRGFVPGDVPFVEGSILDTDLVTSTLRTHEAEGVVHVAGFKYAGVSVQRPLHTYEQNVTGTVSVLRAMEDAGVDKVVFSSSAATFGTPDVDTVTEETATSPESPYGETKLIGEWLLRDQGTATGLRHTSLRYFNVVGSGSDEVYDTSPHNLFPLVLEALVAGRTPRINGDDYATPDGTCVRDYIHVADLAVSHVAAAEALVTGVAFDPEIHPRRPGDPARIVASGELAARDLDWRMRHSVDDMVASAWQARKAHA